MSSIISAVSKDLKQYYSESFILSKGYPLLDKREVGIILISYSLLCYWGYTRARNDAKPILKEGKWVLRAYNIFQVIFSAYIAYLCCTTFLYTLVTTGTLCEPMRVNVSKNPQYYSRQTFTTYLFYISKLVDIIDTLFIILRSKWRQLSFLHIFHHFSVIALGWLAATYHPCGYHHISIQLNAPVHVFMYFYYFLSSFPELAPYLWWKKYITKLQLAQFLSGIFAAVVCFCKRLHSGEEASRLSLIYTFIVIFYGLALLALFLHFYAENYSKAKKKKKSKKDD